MVAMVVITCPETDREIPTGIMTDLARFHRLGEGYATVPCPHCKGRHAWSRHDAYLSITFTRQSNGKTKHRRVSLK